MQKQSTNEVMTQQLALLESKIFDVCPIQDVINDNHRVYTDFMCSEAAEDPFLRQTVTVSHKAVMKLLACVQTKTDPYETVMLQITFES